nr:hypothetical protein [Candidatus Freyarchaeota archaeon]
MAKQVSYEGTFRGLVTGDSGILQAKLGETSNSNMFAPNFYGPAEAYFVMKLEEGFEGVPEEILVQTSKFGYFGIGDEITLQGTIFKINLKRWNRPLYVILADHFYNESLQIGDGQFLERKQVLYEGTIRGSVTKKSIIKVRSGWGFAGTYFAMRLEENIGIKGIPDEILVRSDKAGYFGIGDKVIIEGRIVKKNLKHWGRPDYTLEANHYYNESLQTGDEGLMEREQVLYEGTIRGSVTKESIIKVPIAEGFVGTYFAMKLEEKIGIKEIPSGILVQTSKFGYSGIFGYSGMGDEVILQGRVVKEDLSRWRRPMYVIKADHFYNESLQIGDERFTDHKEALYEGMIRGLVTRESRTGVSKRSLSFAGTYFAMRLEENIGIKGIPDEILVRSDKAGCFRIGDKVIIEGRIIKEDLSQWRRPMYTIQADHYYNESLQIGD